MATYTLHFLNAEADWRGTVVRHLVEHLRAGGYSVQLKEVTTFELWKDGGRSTSLPMRDSLAILQNDGTGALHVMDFHDWPDPFDVPDIAGDPRLKVLLRCQYRDGAFRGDGHERIRPWTYFDSHWPALEPKLDEFRRRRRTELKLHFRGHLWKEREPVIRSLQRRGLLPANVEAVPFESYLDELASYRVILSLPGMGEFCHRDMEAFALGSAVLRTEPRNQIHERLMADHHYVSIPGDAANDPPELVADRIEKRFHQVVRNAGYLRYVGYNAREWYDRNVRLTASMRLTESLLELER